MPLNSRRPIPAMSAKRRAALADRGVTNPMSTFTPRSRESKTPKLATRPSAPRFAAVMPSEQHGREVVYKRSGGVCERCCAARGQEWHHRQNRSQGGTWAPSNGLHLCRPCHRFVTENPTAALDAGWRVERGQNPAAMAVKLGAHGVCLLDDAGRFERIGRVAA